MRGLPDEFVDKDFAWAISGWPCLAWIKFLLLSLFPECSGQT